MQKERDTCYIFRNEIGQQQKNYLLYRTNMFTLPLNKTTADYTRVKLERFSVVFN